MRRLPWVVVAVAAALPRAAGAAAAAAPPRAAGEAGSPDRVTDVEPLTPARLEAVLAAGRCSGPTVVFFGAGKASDEQEAAALEEVSSTAKELSGLACFKALSCGRWPDACADRNLRRLPAVIVFPSGGGAARLYAGRIEKRGLSNEVARLAVAVDRTSRVTGDEAVAWLQSTLRPIKVVLLSSKTSTPTILRALSGDRRFWPHVDFGFAKESDKTLVQYFQASEVPFIAAQCGGESATRQVYNGNDLTFSALHQWLYGLIYGADAPFAKCLADAILTAQTGEAEESEPVEEVVLPYERLAYGANGCPPGSEIKSVQECESAITMLGYDVDPRWVSQFPELPRGCSIREETNANQREHMHFNSAPSGQGRDDLAPICKAAAAPPGAPPAPPDAAAASPGRPPAAPAAPATAPKAARAAAAVGQPAAKPRQPESGLLPELSGATHKELLGSEGFSFIYLGLGQITSREVDMLLAVREEFEARLSDQGTKLRWMWMNAQAERKVARAFDPPTLPSALILNPHKRPRFAAARHEEADGSGGDAGPLPVTREAIVRLLNQVLGGDARFTQVPAFKLTVWADRGAGAGTASQGSARRPAAPAAAAVTPRQEAQPGGRTSAYERLEYGSEGCPPGTGIESVQECEQALKSLGINAEPKWVAVYPELPSGCSVRESVDSDKAERMHFNSSPIGQGRKDLAPVCRAPAAPAAGPAPPAVPELAGRNHRELFGSEGLSFIYLREGPITREDTRMLLALEERFRPQLEQRGQRLAWMWLDVRVERKLAGAFDPEVLPSAVVLSPHGKPRFALLTHEERDGEPLPADEASIVLLLDRVLSGDAEFRPLPSQRLAAWADGTAA